MTVTQFTRDDAAIVAAFTLGLSMFVQSQLLAIALLIPVLALTLHAALGRESSGFDGIGPRTLLIRRVALALGVTLFADFLGGHWNRIRLLNGFQYSDSRLF